MSFSEQKQNFNYIDIWQKGDKTGPGYPFPTFHSISNQLPERMSLSPSSALPIPSIRKMNLTFHHSPSTSIQTTSKALLMMLQRSSVTFKKNWNCQRKPSGLISAEGRGSTWKSAKRPQAPNPIHTCHQTFAKLLWARVSLSCLCFQQGHLGFRHTFYSSC